MEIQSVNILKFQSGKVIIYPLRTIKHKGSYAIPPYIVTHDITYEELAELLKTTLNFSGIGISPPHATENFYHKDNIKITGIRNSKMMHDKSMHIGVYTKDDQYHISPSVNKGSRLGFVYGKENISIPLGSSIDELAMALKEAFDKSS